MGDYPVDTEESKRESSKTRLEIDRLLERNKELLVDEAKGTYSFFRYLYINCALFLSTLG